MTKTGHRNLEHSLREVNGFHFRPTAGSPIAMRSA